MRKCEEVMCRIVDAMMAGRMSGTTKKVPGNMVVTVCMEYGTPVIRVYLHGNCIAMHDPTIGWRFSFAGWVTHTTASRLNALASRFVLKRVSIRKGIPHVGDQMVSPFAFVEAEREFGRAVPQLNVPMQFHGVAP